MPSPHLLILQTGTAAEGQAGGRAPAFGTGLLAIKPVTMNKQDINMGQARNRVFRRNIAFQLPPRRVAKLNARLPVFGSLAMPA